MKPKITFLSCDLSNNNVGRIYVLAELLSTEFEIEVIGPQFGKDIWNYLNIAKFKVKSFPAKKWPVFSSVAREIIKNISGDIIFACKPLPTSFGLALAGKKRQPLFLDIDDWEIAFFRERSTSDRIRDALAIHWPNSYAGVRLCEFLTARADYISVASTFLQNKYGGQLVYHVRDTDKLDPGLFDREKIRYDLGFSDDFVVLFLGSMTEGKGIMDAVEAIQLIDEPRVKLILVGTFADKSLASRVQSHMGDRIEYKGPSSYEESVKYWAAADCALIPQRNTLVAQAQVPAKLFDAMAMGKPIISTQVSDIPRIIGEAGIVVEPGNIAEIAESINQLSSDSGLRQRLGDMARFKCVENYSYTSARAGIMPGIMKLLKDRGL